MATGVSTIAALNSNYITTLFEDAVTVARANNVMAGLVTVFSDQTGDQDRKLATYPQISASTVAETDDFSNPTQFTKTNLSTLTPAEIMAQVLLTDRRLETDPQNARSDASIELGNAIADKYESDLLGDLASLTGGTISSPGTAMSWSNFFAARALLSGTKVPGPYVAVLHEYQWYALAKAATVAGQATVVTPAVTLRENIESRYYVGSVLDVDIYTTANIAAGGTVTTGMFNRAAIALDNRRSLRLEPERDASKRAWELNVTAKYAHGVWRPAFGVKITTDASAPTG